MLLEVWAAQTSAVPWRRDPYFFFFFVPVSFLSEEYPISPLCLRWLVPSLRMESQSAMSTTNRSTEQWRRVWTLKLQPPLPLPPLLPSDLYNEQTMTTTTANMELYKRHFAKWVRSRSSFIRLFTRERPIVDVWKFLQVFTFVYQRILSSLLWWASSS